MIWILLLINEEAGVTYTELYQDIINYGILLNPDTILCELALFLNNLVWQFKDKNCILFRFNMIC